MCKTELIILTKNALIGKKKVRKTIIIPAMAR